MTVYWTDEEVRGSSKDSKDKKKEKEENGSDEKTGIFQQILSRIRGG